MERQSTGFDPTGFPDQQHAARALTLLLRGLRLGERAVLPNGTVVKSIGIRHGAHLRRRYAVTHKMNGSPEERHRAVVLGQEACQSATEAATKALGLTGGEQ